MKRNQPNRAIRRAHIKAFDLPLYEEFCRMNGIEPKKLPLSSFKKMKWPAVERAAGGGFETLKKAMDEHGDLEVGVDEYNCGYGWVVQSMRAARRKVRAALQQSAGAPA